MITRREPACGLEAKPQESFSARTMNIRPSIDDGVSRRTNLVARRDSDPYHPHYRDGLSASIHFVAAAGACRRRVDTRRVRSAGSRQADSRGVCARAAIQVDEGISHRDSPAPESRVIAIALIYSRASPSQIRTIAAGCAHCCCQVHRLALSGVLVVHDIFNPRRECVALEWTVVGSPRADGPAQVDARVSIHAPAQGATIEGGSP